MNVALVPGWVLVLTPALGIVALLTIALLNGKRISKVSIKRGKTVVVIDMDKDKPARRNSRKALPPSSSPET